jgi:hypothetical protein
MRLKHASPSATGSAAPIASMRAIALPGGSGFRKPPRSPGRYGRDKSADFETLLFTSSRFARKTAVTVPGTGGAASVTARRLSQLGERAWTLAARVVPPPRTRARSARQQQNGRRLARVPSPGRRWWWARCPLIQLAGLTGHPRQIQPGASPAPLTRRVRPGS